MYASTTTTTTITGALAAFLLLATPALAGRGPYAGPVDVHAACAQQWGEANSNAVCSNGANNWKCGPDGRSVDIDLYCKQTYGNDVHSDPQGGQCNDWGCYHNGDGLKIRGRAFRA